MLFKKGVPIFLVRRHNNIRFLGNRVLQLIKPKHPSSECLLLISYYLVRSIHT